MTDNQIQTNFYNQPSAVGSTAPKANQTASSDFTGLFQNAVNAAGAQQTTDMDDIFERASQQYRVPINLLKAVAKVESGFDADAVSSSGAQGVMQLMPSTAKGLGVTNPLDPEQNIMGGAKYISQMLDRYDGNVGLALAAYNAGSGNVAKYGGIPPFKETQTYVTRVMDYAGIPLDAPMIQQSSSELSDLFGSGSSSNPLNSLDMLNSLLGSSSAGGGSLPYLGALLGDSAQNDALSTINNLLGESSGFGSGVSGLGSNISSQDYLSLLQVLLGQMQADSTQAMSSDLTGVLDSDSSDSSYGLL